MIYPRRRNWLQRWALSRLWWLILPPTVLLGTVLAAASWLLLVFILDLMG